MASKIYQNRLESDKHIAEKFYLRENSSDIHFIVNGFRVPAHKIILAASSEVYERMFFGGWKENGDVDIVDASVSAFKEFLQYFYLAKVELTEANIAELLYLGQKYNIQNCIDNSIHFLIDSLNEQNVCHALSSAIVYDTVEGIEQLTFECEALLMVKTDAVFKSIGFLNSSKQALARILSMDVFSVPEIEVFEACMECVKAKCGPLTIDKENVLIHLGELIFEIRFNSIEFEELTRLERKYEKLMTNEVMCEILSMQLNLKKSKFTAKERFLRA